MNNIIKDFPNRYMIKVANAIMLDDEINKMLYYYKEKDKDIYSLLPVENPVSKLRDDKVFIDRRIEKVCKEGDISVFINMYSNTPYTKNFTKSKYIKNLKVEIGVVCHTSCRKTLNGSREVIVFNRIAELLTERSDLHGVGEVEVESTRQMYNMPHEFTGYSIIISLEYFGDM